MWVGTKIEVYGVEMSFGIEYKNTRPNIKS